jgi:hypothetical protein
MADTYLAEFDTPAGSLWSSVFRWSPARHALLPGDYWRVLRQVNDVDVTLRVQGGQRPTVVMILTADSRDSLTTLLASLDDQQGATDVMRAASASEYDALVDLQDYRFHLHAQHEGYCSDGKPLGCDFRLYSSWIGQAAFAEVQYQLCLRAHPTGPEQERRVRKYLAWLELEHPFTEPVRELQKLLSSRLLEPTWLADEYLLFNSKQVREEWRERIDTHFAETTGKIGFAASPLESGDFSDLLMIGYHSVRDGIYPMAVPNEAAESFGNDEFAWLVRQTLVAGDATDKDIAPDIFISYASGDFARADAVRQSLESDGHLCWIAPRDINTGGLPYTQAIPLAIKNARVIVVLLSASANLSMHIPRELDLAVERKLPIIPLRLADITPSGQLEYLLRTCQWLDLFDKDHSVAIKELEDRIDSMMEPR